jgi:hypothetical protein
VATWREALGRRKPAPGGAGSIPIRTVSAAVPIRPVPAGGIDATRHRRAGDVIARRWSGEPPTRRRTVHRWSGDPGRAFERQHHELID